MQTRYDAAVCEAASRGADAPRIALELAVRKTKAVSARYYGEVSRLAYSDDEIYTTFYGRLRAAIRAPGGDKWERLRTATDALLFGPLNKEEIRFAALTLDETGLLGYGDWLLFARESMIAHRSTVFEENSVLFRRRHRKPAGEDDTIPAGYRAAWDDRHRLAVAKLAPRLRSVTVESDFPALILHPGPDLESDEFLEAHIFGPLTIRSFEKISGRHAHEPLPPKEQRALEERLAKWHVTLEL